MRTLNFKNIFLGSLVLAFLVIFSFSAVKALTAAEYDDALNKARTSYENAVKQVKDNYIAKMNAAIQKQADDLQAASDFYQQKQITQDEYNAKIAEINNAFNKAFADASVVLRQAISNARKGYTESRPSSADYTPPPVTTPPPATPTTPPPATTPPPTSSDIVPIPSNITVKTLTPQAFTPRYGVMCGLPSGESINPGETKYYKIDMTKWIEWQRVYVEKGKSVSVPRLYNLCMSVGQGVLQQYNEKCNAATGSPKDGLVNGVCSTAECTRLAWIGTCKTAPDPNYASFCDQQRTTSITQLDNALKDAEALYKSGNYTTFFPAYVSTPLYFGCEPYNSSWGCSENGYGDRGANPFLMAVGIDQLPVYEKISNFIKAYPYPNLFKLMMALDADKIKNWNNTHPWSRDMGYDKMNQWNQERDAFWNDLEFKLYDNHPIVAIDESVIHSNVMALVDVVKYGANSIYLMFHNTGSQKRDFMVGFGCPTAVTK